MRNPDRPRGGGVTGKLFGRLAPTGAVVAALVAGCGDDVRPVIEPDEGPIENADAGVAGVDAGIEGESEAEAESESESESESEAVQLPDADGDDVPDEIDPCPQTPDAIDPSTGLPVNTDGDSLSNACDPCPQNPDDGGIDSDEDRVGDICDLAPDTFDPTNADRDHDGVGDIIDNCDLPNPTATPTPPGETPVQTDDDGDGVGAPCDPDDHDDTIYPGAPDAPCDGTDSNGDGVGRTLVTNADGTVTIQGEPDCECIPGTTRTVGTDVGPCVPAEEECQYTADGEGSGFVQTNPGENVEPSDEGTVCDEIDNDCDGPADEELTCPLPAACDFSAGETRPCAGNNTAPCSSGTQGCNPDGTWSDVCVGARLPAATDNPCNEIDDNCNGHVDDARLNPATGEPRTCTGARGVCATRTGVKECPSVDADADELRCSVDPGGSNGPTEEDVCDGNDNNCNGRTDEDPQTVVGGMIPGETGVAGAAYVLPGECGPTVLACNGPRAVQPVSAASRIGVPTADEVLCDGRDNNCNGSRGEGCDCATGDTRPCGSDEGECRPGTQRCNDGEWEECVPGQGPVAENCANGLDDDCDGRTDEPRTEDCSFVRLDGSVGHGEFVCDPATGRPSCADD